MKLVETIEKIDNRCVVSFNTRIHPLSSYGHSLNNYYVWGFAFGF